jgi:hypothetical protein
LADKSGYARHGSFVSSTSIAVADDTLVIEEKMGRMNVIFSFLSL